MKDFVTIYMPIIFLFMATWLFHIGGIVIVKRRPYILKTYHLMIFMLLSFTPALIMPILQMKDLMSSFGSKAYISLLTPLLYIVILLFFRLVMKGYVIFGVTKDSFREPLLRTLKDLELEHDETIYGIVLKDSDTLIQTNIQTQIGTAQLFSTESHTSVLKPIICELKQYYQSTKVDVKYACSIFYCILAGFMFFAGIILLLLARQIPS